MITLPPRRLRRATSARERVNHPIPSSEARDHDRPRGPLIEAILVFTVLLVLGVIVNYEIVFEEGLRSPGPADQLGHLTKVWYIGEGLLDSQGLAAWFPYWYCGQATYQYYPPLSYFIMLLFQLLSRNALTVYKCVVLLFPAVGGTGAYFAARKFGGRVSGIITAILFAFHPYNLRTLKVMGNFAQSVVCMLGPFALVQAHELIVKNSRKAWLFSAAVWGLMIVGHAMCAAVFAGAVGLLVVYWVLEAARPMKILTWLGSVASGLVFTGFWTVPGMMRLEDPNIPYLLPERAAAQSISWFVFDPSHRYVIPYDQYFSLVLSLLAVVSVITLALAHPNERRKIFSLGFVLLVTVAIAFGVNNPLFRFIPLHDQIVPDRILNFASFIQVLLVALLFEAILGWGFISARAVPAVGCLVLVAVLAWFVVTDCHPYSALAGVSDYTLLKSLLSQIPHSGTDPFLQGRLSIDTYDWVSAANYFPVLEKIALTDGWNQEGTTHQLTMVEQNVVASYGFWDYHLRNYMLRNVRSVIVRDADASPLVTLLKNEGFTESDKEPYVSVLVSSKPSSYVHRMDESMITIGNASLWACTVFPWSARGSDSSLLSYDMSILDGFATVYLDEPAPDPVPELENAIRRMTKAGISVVVDLSNSPIPSLFGVSKQEIGVSGPVQFEGTQGSPFDGRIGLDVTRYDGNPLRGASYTDLDGEWLTLEYGGTSHTIAGYRDLPEGRVYFVGMGSARSVIDTRNRGLSKLVEPVLSLSSPRTSISPPAFPVGRITWSPKGLAFQYQSGDDAHVLLSVTYTPRWRVTVDDQPIQAHSLDNFVYMALPAGSHAVRLQYSMTWVGFLGMATTAAGVIVAILVALTWNRGVGRLEEHIASKMKRVMATLRNPDFWNEPRKTPAVKG